MSVVESVQKRRSWFARHKILTALGAIVILIIAISALSSGDEEPTTTTSDNAGAADGEQPAAGAEGAGVGDPVRDGKFEFTVNSVECGETELGDDILGTTAQGQFCLVSLTVENIGDEPQSLFGDNQYLLDSEGRKFSADTEAQLYLDEGQLTIYEEVNPGNSVEGIVVFDVPEGVELAGIELHNSALSGGVTVDLTN
jgi:hypothetical protein